MLASFLPEEVAQHYPKAHWDPDGMYASWRITLVPVADVLYLKAELKYVTLRTRTGEHLIEEPLVSIEKDARELVKHVDELEFQRMFNNPLDPNNCFIEIQAGAGGTEAQDWAGMLLRMYLRFAERRGF